MSIIVKKKRKYYRKKIIYRIFILMAIYLISFFSLYAVFGEKPAPLEEISYANDGERYMAEGKYPEAMEFFKKALTKDSEDYIAMNRLGRIYKNLKQYDKAKFYFFKSKTIAPFYQDNYVQAVSIYTEERDFEIAKKIIDIMPAKSKWDFLKKSDALILIAENIPDKEDKIIYYNRALTYYKEYDKALYDTNLKKLILIYFDVADYYISNSDISGAVAIYDNILKAKDDCFTNNALAKKYVEINETVKALHCVKNAVAQAKSQDEKRETLQTLIVMRNYFEATYNNNAIKIIKDYMNILHEETILVDEKYSQFAVIDDTIEFIEKSGEIFPILNLKVKNNTDKDVTSLYIKLEAYIEPNNIYAYDNKEVKLKNFVLLPDKVTREEELKLTKGIPTKAFHKYSIALSISTDEKDWKLYRLYNKDK